MEGLFAAVLVIVLNSKALACLENLFLVPSGAEKSIVHIAKVVPQPFQEFTI
jgi:hypothetical protein